tara:strand:- start:1270 stop:1464 length:195 start_codon:yes stop_codon:yes gene_type:complete
MFWKTSHGVFLDNPCKALLLYGGEVANFYAPRLKARPFFLTSFETPSTYPFRIKISRDFFERSL